MTSTQKINLLVLLGPTAVGKTKLSLAIAEKYRCEIISGDSMQVYRGMDIGTAKATEAEQRLVRHHMIDIIEPHVPFSASQFQQRTQAVIHEIEGRGCLPLLVGGTGLYIESLCYGYHFNEVGSDPSFRAEMEALVAMKGNDALHGLLREVDPLSAERLFPNDVRRVIRALEVHRLTGMPMSQNQTVRNVESLYNLCLIGLTRDREELYERINQRVDDMLAAGLLQEVERLLAGGCTAEMISMKALGYKELIGYLQGQYTYDRAVSLIKQKSRHFAKRQMSWFRHMSDIQWIHLSVHENFHEHFQIIGGIIERMFTSSRAD